MRCGGTIVADLYIDSEALADFAGQLRGLLADFSAPIMPPAGAGDGSLQDVLMSLSATDTGCGSGLNNYLTALAGLAGQAAQAAERLDAALAHAVPPHVHGHMLETTF